MFIPIRQAVSSVLTGNSSESKSLNISYQTKQRWRFLVCDTYWNCLLVLPSNYPSSLSVLQLTISVPSSIIEFVYLGVGVGSCHITCRFSSFSPSLFYLIMSCTCCFTFFFPNSCNLFFLDLDFCDYEAL